MITKQITELYVRDLNKAADEIDQYESDDHLWKVSDGISNSGGNLGLHLAGNINHFFGANLGSTGYVRERDLEFSLKGKSRAEVSAALRDAANVVSEALGKISEDDLAADYPEPFGGETVSMARMILHLLTHLDYHLGQINYHRRLVG